MTSKRNTKATPEVTKAPALREVYTDLTDEKAFKRVKLEQMVDGTYVFHTYEPRRGDNGEYLIVLVENQAGTKAVVATSAFRVCQKLTQLAVNNHLPVTAKVVKQGNGFDLV